MEKCSATTILGNLSHSLGLTSREILKIVREDNNNQHSDPTLMPTNIEDAVVQDRADDGVSLS